MKMEKKYRCNEWAQKEHLENDNLNFKDYDSLKSEQKICMKPKQKNGSKTSGTIMDNPRETSDHGKLSKEDHQMT